jgi:hypothetical protein
MKQVVIIPRQQRDIVDELSDCIACLEKSEIHVYAAHRGQDYAVLWADDPAISTGVQILRNAGFKTSQLTRTRSLKLRH